MEKYNKNMKRRGQVTIFVIIGILIVALGILIYIFYPKLQSTLGFGDERPSVYLQKCIEEKVSESVEILSSQGGSIEPENYYLYKDDKIEYLCYNEEYYLPCIMQKPMLKNSIEEEIKKNIEDDFATCLKNMYESFKKRGYQVKREAGEIGIELLPNIISLYFEGKIVLTKGEDVKTYDSAKVVITNNLYEMISIANSILNWEATYGDAETTTYMNYYHDLKVEKYKQSDGTTIYILTNRDTGEKFQFASRSIAWPEGYEGGEFR